LYIISTLGLGGAERVVCDLADEMFEKGHEVKVVYFLGEVMTRLANQGIEIVKVNRPGTVNASTIPERFIYIYHNPIYAK